MAITTEGILKVAPTRRELFGNRPGATGRPTVVRSSTSVSAWWILLVGCFCTFLYPFSVGGATDVTYSVNYSFILLAVAQILTQRKIQQPAPALLFTMLTFNVVFVMAVMSPGDLGENALRRLISFAVFMSMFSFVFVLLDERTIEAFKAALVFTSLYLTAVATWRFYQGGGMGLHFEAKDIVGSQRIGFIHILAFWIVQGWIPGTAAMRKAKYLIVPLVLCGLALTFSRASLVAFAVSLVAFILGARSKSSAFRGWGLSFLVIALCVFAGLFIVQSLFPIVFEFFDARLFEYFRDSDAAFQNLSDRETSEGTRIYIWESVINYVAVHPLTGTGYLGVWTLNLFGSDSIGSAHNQYMDILLRVGVPGFVAYVCLLYWIGKTLRARGDDLFTGYIGVIAYGCFHETFKESQGGFVLAFLLGIAAQQTVLRSTSAAVVVRRYIGSERDLALKTSARPIPAMRRAVPWGSGQ